METRRTECKSDLGFCINYATELERDGKKLYVLQRYDHSCQPELLRLSVTTKVIMPTSKLISIPLIHVQ